MSDFARQMLRPEPWSDLMMGNHAIVRAMLEAGTQVVTTYPGSPTPEIADAILALPEAERPFHFEYSLNEKVALEHAFGASMNGHPSAVFFNSVGLNVVADSAVQLSLLELGGGMVVILGDDPGANSSQNEQDNRHFARMAAIPVFEPASPSEAYGMYLDAAKLARARHMPVFLRLTTHVCHQRELVHFGALPTEPADWTPRFEAHDGEFIPITAAVFPMKKRAFAKLAELEREGCTSRWNRIVASPQQPSRLGVLWAC